MPAVQPFGTRRSVRLKGYDYATRGAYFVTIVLRDRVCRFGQIVGGRMFHNEIGGMVERAWRAIPQGFSQVHTDAFVVMPNHLHGIVVMGAQPLLPSPVINVEAESLCPSPAITVETCRAITKDASNATTRAAFRATTRAASRATTRAASRATTRVAPTLGAVVGAFKSLTTVEYARGVRALGWPGFDGSLWQRSFYEHIIRDEKTLASTREYIASNPGQWAEDDENPFRPT